MKNSMFWLVFGFLFSFQKVTSENKWEYVPSGISDSIKTIQIKTDSNNSFGVFPTWGSAKLTNEGWCVSSKWKILLDGYPEVPDILSIDLKLSSISSSVIRIRFKFLLEDSGGTFIWYSNYAGLNYNWSPFYWDAREFKGLIKNFKKGMVEIQLFSENSGYFGADIAVDNYKGTNDTLGNVVIYDNFEKTTGILVNKKQTPNKFILYQNYPNPFNPSTTIKFSVPQSGHVNLVVFNLLGQEVQTLVSEEKVQGNYEVKFDASNLPSGIYFYKLQTGDFVETKKMVFVK